MNEGYGRNEGLEEQHDYGPNHWNRKVGYWILRCML